MDDPNGSTGVVKSSEPVNLPRLAHRQMVVVCVEEGTHNTTGVYVVSDSEVNRALDESREVGNRQWPAHIRCVCIEVEKQTNINPLQVTRWLHEGKTFCFELWCYRTLKDKLNDGAFIIGIDSSASPIWEWDLDPRRIYKNSS